MIASLRRIAGMTQRYWRLLVSSWPRVLELVYWPMMQILVWGTLQIYLSEQFSNFAQISGSLVGGVLLFDVLVRGQLGLSVTFLEEMWSNNLGNLLMSPLRPGELVASMLLMSSRSHLDRIGASLHRRVARLQFQRLSARSGLGAVLSQSPRDLMGDRIARLRARAALRRRRGKPRLVPRIRTFACVLRLLPRLRVAGMVAAALARAGANLRLRGLARHGVRKELSSGSHVARGVPERPLSGGGLLWLPATSQRRARLGIPSIQGRMRAHHRKEHRHDCGH